MSTRKSDSPAGGEPDGPKSHEVGSGQSQGNSRSMAGPSVRGRVVLNLTGDAEAMATELRHAYPLRGHDVVLIVGITGPAGIGLRQALAGVRSIDVLAPSVSISDVWVRAIEWGES